MSQSQKVDAQHTEAGAGAENMIRSLIDDWAVCRDTGQWDRFADIWHPDGHMSTTWFTGTAAEFIESSRRAFENGFDVVHTSSGSAVTVSGERAIAQTRMTISQRAALHDVDVDVTCHGRFFDFFVNSGDSGRRNRQEWSLVRRQPIYDRDRVDPVKPGAVPQLDFTAMSKFPHGYQHLGYLQTLQGFEVRTDLPVSRGPPLCQDQVRHLQRTKCTP